MDQASYSHRDRLASSRHHPFDNLADHYGPLTTVPLSASSISRETIRPISLPFGEGGIVNDGRRGNVGASGGWYNELHSASGEQDRRVPPSHGVIPPRSRARLPLISDLPPRREYRLLSRLGDGVGNGQTEGTSRYNQGNDVVGGKVTAEWYQEQPAQSSYHLLPRPSHSNNYSNEVSPVSHYENLSHPYPSPSPDPLAPTPRLPHLPLGHPWEQPFRSERPVTAGGGIPYRGSHGASYTPTYQHAPSSPRLYHDDPRPYRATASQSYQPSRADPLRSIGSSANLQHLAYSSNPPSHSSYDLRVHCPTPDLLYVVDPNEPAPSSSRVDYADIFALEQQRAEAAIWADQDRFRRQRREFAQRRGLQALSHASPASLLHPTYPVIFPPVDENPVRFKRPGIHILPLPTSVDPEGRMPPRKAVAARPKAMVAAAAAAEAANPGRRKEVQVIGGKETSVTILSDSEEPIQNGVAKAVPAVAPRRRAPVRAAAQAAAANAANANGNGTTSTSTRKRKVADDDSASVVGPASKRVVKVNGKAGTSASTATQSTIATVVGANATEAVMNSYKQKHPAMNQVPPPTLASGSGAAVAGQATAEGPPWDDKDGHYIVQPNTLFGIRDRYRIVRLLGQGTFGKVVEAREQATNRKVAIKIIRAVQKYRDASAIEIRVLQALRKGDPTNVFKCIHLLEMFDFRNHVCLVSELFGMSVFDFLKENKFQPFPERHIQEFAKSLLKSLSYVHSLNLIHTDLKPENILLVHNGYDTIGERRANAKQKHILKNPDIRLIDFGSATFSNEFHSSVVSTRHYRAPEIILGLGWSFPCDMFSVGCILVEFFTGDALFQTHDNLEHLAMMEVVMGKMPQAMAHKASKLKGEFFKGLKLDYPNSTTSKNSKKFVKSMVPLREIIHPSTPLRREFLDLIERLLAFDPQKRITVAQALGHQYLREATPNLPTCL